MLAIFIVGMTLGVAVAEPANAKTFKSGGYKWTIKNSKWKSMKKQANKEYKKAKKQKRMNKIGYSKGVKVKVTKNGHKYYGTAYAIKNTKYLRCQINDAVPGLSISNKGNYPIY